MKRLDTCNYVIELENWDIGDLFTSVMQYFKIGGHGWKTINCMKNSFTKVNVETFKMYEEKV